MSSLVFLAAWSCRREPVTKNGDADRRASAPSAAVPADRLPALESAIQISAAEAATCALLSTGRVACWGSFGPENCGSGVALACAPAPRPVELPGDFEFRKISLWGSARGLTADGRLMQWGHEVHPFRVEGRSSRSTNLQSDMLESYDALATSHPEQIAASRGGQWADTGAFDSARPVWTGIDGVRQLRFLSCYEDASGDVSCARSDRSEHGWHHDGPISLPPADLVFLGFYASACVREEAGTIACWRVLDGEWDHLDREAVMRLPMPRPVKELMVGLQACAVLDDGSVACFDANALAEITPDSVNRLALDVMPGLDAVGVAEYTGRVESCAVTSKGQVACWYPKLRGLDAHAQSKPSTHDPDDARRIEGVEGVVALAGGGEHMCALTGPGQVWCWGDNRRGQCGVGAISDGDTRPTRVVSAVPFGAER